MSDPASSTDGREEPPGPRLVASGSSLGSDKIEDQVFDQTTGKSWRELLEAHGQVDPNESLRPDPITRPMETHEAEDFSAVTHLMDPDPRVGLRKISIGAPGDAGPPEFVLEERIATGGMGEVYEAVQTSLGRRLAIKRIKPELADDRRLMQALQVEARITAVLDHPSIVPVHELGVDSEGRVFYGMKRIEGTPWNELLARSRRRRRSDPELFAEEIDEHLSILMRVAEALAYAHSRGILHRDIKPSNVIVGDFGDVKLVDWGLAARYFDPPDEETQVVAHLSQVPIICGTPTYMAPETALGLRELVGAASDVYLLGATLFEILYGEPPHRAETAELALARASLNEWALPDEIPRALEPWHFALQPIVQVALAPDPKDRFENAGALRRALQQGLRNVTSVRVATEAHALLESLRDPYGAAAATLDPSMTFVPSAVRTPRDRYRAITRVIAGLEQALSSWPGNAEARHWLADAHLYRAETSLEEGDFTLVETSLEQLGRLPGTAPLPPDLKDRARFMRMRLEGRHRSVDRRRRLVRTLQGVSVVLIVGAIALGFWASLAVSRSRDQAMAERQVLTEALIHAETDAAHHDLAAVFDPVAGALITAEGWARRGTLDQLDPEALDAMFMPLLEGFPGASSMSRADQDGYEYRLRRVKGGWQTRLIRPGQPAEFRRYDEQGVLEDVRQGELSYDPTQTRFFDGALSMRENGTGARIHWRLPLRHTGPRSEPPGFLASIAARAPDGSDIVVAMEIDRRFLSELTVGLPADREGQVFVLTEDEQVVGLPRTAAFDTPAARAAALLQRPEDLDATVMQRAIQTWDTAARVKGRALRFMVDGDPWWTSFRTFELGDDQRLWIGVAVPESNLLGGAAPAHDVER